MRIVIKIGTYSLLRNDHTLDESILARLAEQICAVRADGTAVALVSSGAVGVGRKLWNDTVGKPRFNDDVLRKQIFASIGQAALIQRYNEVLSRYGMLAAQMLLTRSDFSNRHHSINVGRLLEKLLQQENLLPVINENDCLSLEELMFTDNDELAGLAAAQIGADKLILLTDVNGVYDLDSPDKKVIPRIQGPDYFEYINLSMKGGGRGGMASKLETAKKLANVGIATHIVHAREPNVIERILAGEELGTLIVPSKKAPPFKRWLAMGVQETRGRIAVNDDLAVKLSGRGARANVQPSGVSRVIIPFDEGDVVEIADGNGCKLGHGLTRYDSGMLEKYLGQKNRPALVHYNFLHIDENTG